MVAAVRCVMGGGPLEVELTVLPHLPSMKEKYMKLRKKSVFFFERDTPLFFETTNTGNRGFYAVSAV